MPQPKQTILILLGVNKQRWSAGGWYNNQQNIQAVSPEQRKKDQDERSLGIN
jgi:hypothetical protein